MFNMNYKESEHIKEVRKEYLEKLNKEPKDSLEQIGDAFDMVGYSIEEIRDSERAYSEGYIAGQINTMILTGIGLTVGCIIGSVINHLKK